MQTSLQYKTTTCETEIEVSINPDFKIDGYTVIEVTATHGKHVAACKAAAPKGTALKALDTTTGEGERKQATLLSLSKGRAIITTTLSPKGVDVNLCYFPPLPKAPRKTEPRKSPPKKKEPEAKPEEPSANE